MFRRLLSNKLEPSVRRKGLRPVWMQPHEYPATRVPLVGCTPLGAKPLWRETSSHLQSPPASCNIWPGHQNNVRLVWRVFQFIINFLVFDACCAFPLASTEEGICPYMVLFLWLVGVFLHLASACYQLTPLVSSAPTVIQDPGHLGAVKWCQSVPFLGLRVTGTDFNLFVLSSLLPHS